MGDSEPRDVCVVIPTYNEAGTIRELMETLEELSGRSVIRVVIVDDGSTDGTIGIIEEMMGKHGNIILVERGEKLGFGTAIIDGFRAALTLEQAPEFIVTMDADLSHDPREVPSLVEACDKDSLVVGSRYIKGGEIHGWGLYRKTVSRAANFSARVFVNIPASDCTSGFRCYRTDLVQTILPSLESLGYDIQIETLHEAARHGFSIEERPITFRERRSGESKLKLGDIWGFIKGIYTLFRRSGEWKRVARFTVVGFSGVFVNEAALWALTDQMGLHYLLSGSISAETAIINNFLWNDVWTFRDVVEKGSASTLMRLIRFNLSRITGLIFSIILLAFFTEFLKINYLLSNIISILVVFTYNYLLSNIFVWRS